MVDADDVQGYRTKYDNQLSKLKEADIDENDREAIHRFVVHLRTNDTDVGSLGTVVGHLNRMRLAAERTHMPLTKMEELTDINTLKLHLTDEEGLGEGTVRNYMKSVRKFFIWRGEDWGDSITVGAPPERKHEPDEELTDDEIDLLLETCKNPRDRALIALLADTGLRIGAVLSLRLRHLDVDSKRSTVTINDSANIKGDDGPKPITWSRSYVANWLSGHPRSDNPDAALIHKLRQWSDNGDGALSQQYAGRLLSDIAEEAGLGGDRVSAHLFRGSAISRWIREDMSDQAIKHRAGWSKDSRMFQVYSRVTDGEMNDVVFDHYEIDGDEEADRPSLDECPSCLSPLRGHEEFCPSCAHPLTSTAATTVDEVDDATFKSMRNAGEREGDFFAEFRRRFNSDPDFRGRIVGDGAGDHDDPS